ncbi:MAG: transposase [Candidatus Competibacteraceae bacterium]|nr:transposase [Candidatus Competibacteraceae bacterium]
MSRPLRIELPGGFYHVTSRGDRRDDIFLDDNDRLLWLDTFGNVCERFNWICHAYCLMGNHYHIVIETLDGDLSKGMRQLNGVYTQQFNRKHARIGHVFQGRYKGILVQKDSYLLELSRYVVLNPVRAQWINDPGEWLWSSYRAMIGEAPCPDWLNRDALLKLFGKRRKVAAARYREFVLAGISAPRIWRALKNQIYLGDDKFVEQMQRSILFNSNLDEVPGVQHRPVAKPVDHYVNRFKNRKEGMARAHLEGRHTLKAVAQHFQVHYSTVSRAVKLFEAKAKK